MFSRPSTAAVSSIKRNKYYFPLPIRRQCSGLPAPINVIVEHDRIRLRRGEHNQFVPLSATSGAHLDEVVARHLRANSGQTRCASLVSKEGDHEISYHVLSSSIFTQQQKQPEGETKQGYRFKAKSDHC